jgi:hypothetical protein
MPHIWGRVPLLSMLEISLQQQCSNHSYYPRQVAMLIYSICLRFTPEQPQLGMKEQFFAHCLFQEMQFSVLESP